MMNGSLFEWNLEHLHLLYFCNIFAPFSKYSIASLTPAIVRWVIDSKVAEKFISLNADIWVSKYNIYRIVRNWFFIIDLCEVPSVGEGNNKAFAYDGERFRLEGRLSISCNHKVLMGLDYEKESFFIVNVVVNIGFIVDVVAIDELGFWDLSALLVKHLE